MDHPGALPDPRAPWRAPRWALAVLMASLATVGPFSVDTYLPAFSAIARSLGATPAAMQQTLSAYLAGFALMNLFHGALSDSLGRRPVILWGVAAFALASAGCALSQDIGQLVAFRFVQGLSAGAGMVVSRAIVRDLFPPDEAQRVMSQVTIFFGVAPAVAPILGGLLIVHAPWPAIFWCLAAIGALLWLANWRWLPETLPTERRQPFGVAPLMKAYAALGGDPRFVALAVASGVPFNGMFVYVLSAPAFLGELLHLPPTRFFELFVLAIGGIMAGAWCSGRLAGRIAPKRQVRLGFAVMMTMAVANLALNLAVVPAAPWALLPIGGFSFGWALTVPVVTLMVLDLAPERRGTASSLQASLGSAVNAVVAGVVSPWVMHSAVALAAASLAMGAVGWAAWGWVRTRIV